MFTFLLIICSAVHTALVVVAAASSNRDGGMFAGECSIAGANPWTYNFMVNGYPAKVMNDATASSPLEGGFLAEDPAVLKRALKRRFLNDTVVTIDNNILYVNWDGEGVLFDCGTGPGDAPTLAPGMLFEHLANEGFARDSIKHVMITHAHYDHINGLVEDLESLKPAYPSAKVYMSRVEYEYWTAPSVRLRFACTNLPSFRLSENVLNTVSPWYLISLMVGRRNSVHTSNCFLLERHLSLQRYHEASRLQSRRHSHYKYTSSS
jgi:hypothetical protein